MINPRAYDTFDIYLMFVYTLNMKQSSFAVYANLLYLSSLFLSKW